MTIVVGKFNPTSTGGRHHHRWHDHTGLPRRIAVLGRRPISEREVSWDSAASVREGLNRCRPREPWVQLGRDVTGLCEGDEVALSAGRRPARRDAGFPALHGPFGEVGSVRGCRVPRRPLRRLGCAGLAPCAWTRTSSRSVMVPRRAAAGRLPGRWRRPGAWPWPTVGRQLPLLGQAVAAGVVGGRRPRRRARRARGRDPAAARLLPARDRRGQRRRGSRSSARGSADQRAAGQPAGEIARGGEDGWYDDEASTRRGGWSCGAGARLRNARERVRELAVDRLPPGRRSGLARADLFVDGEGRAAQRAQHHARLQGRRACTGSSGTTADPYPEPCDRLCGCLRALERERLRLF